MINSEASHDSSVPEERASDVLISSSTVKIVLHVYR